MANSITTVAGREKFAKAHAGAQALPKIVQVGWGSGGHNTSTGQPIAPTGNEAIVPGEFLKKAIDGYTFPVSTTIRFNVSLLATEGNGNNVSACGLYDEAGTLIAVKTFTPKAKDNETELLIAWDEEF